MKNPWSLSLQGYVVSYCTAIIHNKLPSMSGFELLAQLRKDAEYQKAPVIIITNRESVEDQTKGKALGADLYLLKRELTAKSLLTAIDNFLPELFKG